MNGIWVWALLGPLCLMFYCSIVPLANFQMPPVFSLIISSGSKQEPRYECLSEARASHAHKTWNEVPSSVLHFLQMGLLLSPITYKCCLRVLCPMTPLDCILLKNNNRALVAKLGPEISSRACLCVQQVPHHITKWWFWQVNRSPHIFGSNVPCL